MSSWIRLRAMVRKDLIRHLRSPLAPSLMLSFPLVFSALLALSFGGDGERVPRVRLLIEDRDDGVVAGLIRSAFTSEQAARYFATEVVSEGGRERLEDGEASALLRLPEGLSRDVLDRQPVVLELVRNPSEAILPEIAEQVTRIVAEVLDSASYALEGPLSLLQPYLAQEGAEPSEAAIAGIAVEVYRLLDRAEKYILPPVIGLENLRREEPESEAEPIASSRGASIFLFILPGVSVFALFSLGDLMMRDLLREGRLGTLRRQFTSPSRPLEVIAAKVAVTFVGGALSLLLLAAVASLIAERAVDLVGFVALAATLLLAVTGAAAVICGLARNERQGATISSVVYLTMAFVGGSFVPLGSLPAAVRSVAPLSPFYWATDGFQRLLEAGKGLGDVGHHVLILFGLGVVLLGLGTALLGLRVRQGALA